MRRPGSDRGTMTLLAQTGFSLAENFSVSPWLIALWGVLAALVQVSGILSGLHALMQVRTAQGTIAWCIALASFPWIAMPLYWVFGRNKFQGYVEILRAAVKANAELAKEVADALEPHHGNFDRETSSCEYTLDVLTRRRFTCRNHVELLVDGEATFKAIFEAIDAAESYILVQFFIIKDDALGKELKNLLVAKAKSGVRVSLLFDHIGSRKLGGEYIADLQTGGVDIAGFGATRHHAKRFHINFRNHRKIVIVDGRIAFVGGHNVGDQYVGSSARFGHWRDTHVAIEGPAVQGVQVVFLEDWYWATRQVPDLHWKPQPVENGHNMCVLPLETGPIDKIEACTLFFMEIISSAKERLWIASPYFVPDEGITNALQLAALRGVDVRILIPDKPDHRLVYLAAFSYLEEMDAAGVKMYRYEGGFLHQKVALVDDHLAAVGTANLDNRSFRLNFEITMVVSDREFAKRVTAMLESDLERSRRIDSSEYTKRHIGFRFAVRISRLLSPLL